MLDKGEETEHYLGAKHIPPLGAGPQDWSDAVTSAQ